MSGVLFIYRALSAQFAVFVAGQHNFTISGICRNQTQQLLFECAGTDCLIAGFFGGFFSNRPIAMFNAGATG